MPVEFRCPITQVVMKKPVMATDGHSYELRAMQKWVLKKQTSPVTGEPLANTTLVINQNLKKLIRDFAATKRFSMACAFSSLRAMGVAASRGCAGTESWPRALATQELSSENVLSSSVYGLCIEVPGPGLENDG